MLNLEPQDHNLRRPTQTKLRPHCPKCKGKPIDGQRKIVAYELNKVGATLRARIEARLVSAYACKTCGAAYSYLNGFSTYLGRL